MTSRVSLERNVITSPGRGKRRWLKPQFGLRALLLFMLLAGAGAGWLAKQMRWAKRQRDIVQKLVSSGFTVQYDDGKSCSYFAPPARQDATYFWQQVDFWHNVVSLQGHYSGERDSYEVITCIAELPELEQLVVNYDRSEQEEKKKRFPSLASRKRLKRLTMVGLPLPADAIGSIAECESLTDLQISTDAKASPELGKLDRLAQLRLLHIDGPAAEKAIAEWQHITRLEMLMLGHLEEVPGKSLAELVSRNPKLVRARLNRARCTPEVCEALSRCSALAELSLSKSQFDDEALARLGASQRLTILNIERTQVRGTGFAGERSFPKLHQLIAEQSMIDDQGAFHLSKLPELRVVDLTQTNITDSAMGHLGGGKLVTLNLSRDRVSDRGMKDFHGQQLEELNLRETQVTPLAFADRSQWPSLKVLQLTEVAKSESDLERVLEIPTLTKFVASTRRQLSPEFLKRHGGRFVYLLTPGFAPSESLSEVESPERPATAP